ncbi:MAG: DNA cytosine methyltransferase [Candidatus Poribacteria bacterium]|nr:DNA cytosine methyltransferase [Candidatus Poribacteria bacterium]
MKTFIDLFAGIGGFRVALEEEQGLECVFSSEKDEEAARVYHRNFLEKPQGDIQQISEKNIPKHDILCAGFPCQSFSISGNHTGFKDNRGQLFYDIVRIAAHHKPPVMLLENVKNILRVRDGAVIRIIRNALESIGYTVHCSLLNASHYGVPQSRSRVYFTCLRKGMGLKFKEPERTYQQIFLRDVLDKSAENNLIIQRDDIHIEKEDEPAPKTAPIRIGYVNKGGQGERIYHPNGHSITLSADGGGIGAKTGLYLIDGNIRRLSLTEGKKVMGFPASHYVSESRLGYKQLGNAVIPKMVSLTYNGVSY